MIAAQMRRRIFRQTMQIEETRVAPLPTKLVKYDGIEASICVSRAPGIALNAEIGYTFNSAGSRKHIDRRYRRHLISGIDKQGGVSRKR